MELEQLHEEVETYVPTSQRTLFHLLVDLGRVERIECQMDECVGETRRLSPYTPGAAGGGPGRGEYDPWSATINHVQPSARGGSSRVENLELAHARCNYRQGGKIADTYGRKIGRWSPEAQERRRVNTAAAMKREDVRAKKSDAMKKRHADPEYKRLAQERAKKAWETRRARARKDDHASAS